MSELELKRIQPNHLNPRQKFSKTGLDELANSIKQYGVLEPLLVRPVNAHYEVVVGERRYRAAQQAGLDTVPVVVRPYSDEEVMEVNLVENVQREDLSAVEKAKLCKELRARWPERYPTVERVASRIGVDASTVRAWMRTLGLPEEVQERIAPREAREVPDGKIGYQTALRIAERIKEPEKQRAVAEQLAEERVPQRVVKEVIRRAAAEPAPNVSEIVQEMARDERPTLSFSHRNYKSVVAGKKTQTTRRRFPPDIREGAVVQAVVSHFADLRIERVMRKRLGDFDEQDAQREGHVSLDEFRKQWERQFGAWMPDEQVCVVQFMVERYR